MMSEKATEKTLSGSKTADILAQYMEQEKMIAASFQHEEGVVRVDLKKPKGSKTAKHKHKNWTEPCDTSASDSDSPRNKSRSNSFRISEKEIVEINTRLSKLEALMGEFRNKMEAVVEKVDKMSNSIINIHAVITAGRKYPDAYKIVRDPSGSSYTVGPLAGGEDPKDKNTEKGLGEK